MAGFIVTINFTANGIAGEADIGVPASMASNTTQAITVATSLAEGVIIAKRPGQTVVFGTTSAIAV